MAASGAAGPERRRRARHVGEDQVGPLATQLECAGRHEFSTGLGQALAVRRRACQKAMVKALLEESLRDVPIASDEADRVVVEVLVAHAHHALGRVFRVLGRGCLDEGTVSGCNYAHKGLQSKDERVVPGAVEADNALRVLVDLAAPSTKQIEDVRGDRFGGHPLVQVIDGQLDVTIHEIELGHPGLRRGFIQVGFERGAHLRPLLAHHPLEREKSLHAPLARASLPRLERGAQAGHDLGDLVLGQLVVGGKIHFFLFILFLLHFNFLSPPEAKYLGVPRESDDREGRDDSADDVRRVRVCAPYVRM